MYSYSPPPVDANVPGRYELKAVESVGNYALKLTWGDGHDHGIYNWEHLHGLCECSECLQLKRGKSVGEN
jgi:DUF971 family protein